MGYATVDEARAAGATGTDPEVQAAVDSASLSVDRLTSAWWDERGPLTLTAPVDRNGMAALPRRPLTVTAVRPAGALSDLPATGYRVETSAVLGGRDRLVLGYRFGGRWDVLRNHDPLHYGPGSEPQTVDVTGTFGSTTTPEPIREATALLAATYTGSPTSVNTEGDATLGTPPRVPALDDTDVPPLVLSLLRPYLPARVRVR